MTSWDRLVVTSKRHKGKSTKLSILEDMNREEAINILQVIVNENPKLGSRIEELTLSILGNIDIEEVTSDVYSKLDQIELEEVWDRSGRTHSRGYIDPGEAADEIFHEILSPFTSKLKRQQNLKLYSEALKQCLGILGGIYQFYKEAASEFKSMDFAETIILEAFGLIESEWNKWCKDPDLCKETDDFIRDNLSDW